MKKVVLGYCLFLLLLISLILTTPIIKYLTSSIVKAWPAPQFLTGSQPEKDMFSKLTVGERLTILEEKINQMVPKKAVLSDKDKNVSPLSSSERTTTGNVITNGLSLTNLPTGILHKTKSGGLAASLIDLGQDVNGLLPLFSGGTGATSFTQNGLIMGNGTSSLQTLSPGTTGYLLSSNGNNAPSWIPYPTFPEMDSIFDTLSVGSNKPFTINNNGQVALSYTGNAGYLSSNGGALYINNTQNIGTGIGIYSNAGSEALGNMINVKVDNPFYSQAAFYMNYDGNSNAVEILSNSNDSSANALSLTSNNIFDSTLGVIGHELSKGTIKVSHYRPTDGTDSNASGISVDLKGIGTRAQGIYVDSTEVGGTLGNLLRLRNTSVDKFVVDYQGNLTTTGNITQGSYGTDTSWTKFGNVTGDQFFVGTNGAFRVQRSVSNSEAFRVQINGDTQGRWRGMSDGSLQWGDGTNAQDVILKRGAVGMLQLTGGITLNNANNAYNTIIKGATDSNLFYVDAATNQIGIGLSSPKAPLHIDKNSLGNAAFIINQRGTGPLMAASSSGSTVFTIDNAGTLRTVASLCVKANISSSCAGNTPGTIYASNTTVQSADLAENYISSQILESGDIVMPASDGNNQAVMKTSQEYQSQTIGIISAKPGVTLNSDATTDTTHPNLYPMALQGRVLVKVTSQNGPIAAGDILTTSSIPGVAMKATKNGTVVAKALEGYNSTDPQSVGKIMVFVGIAYHDFADTHIAQAPTKTGQVVLPTGTTEVEIKTEALKDGHLFVQPEDIPITTAVKKKADDTFLVKIATPQTQDILLSWWLVN